jgi:hypothetical protein
MLISLEYDGQTDYRYLSWAIASAEHSMLTNYFNNLLQYPYKIIFSTFPTSRIKAVKHS